MILIDTSIWIQVFRDKQGLEAQRIQEWINGREVVLTRFIQLELLQGCRDEKEWHTLSVTDQSPRLNGSQFGYLR